MGMPGAQWLVKLRQHLLNQIREAAKPVKQDMVQATCDNCHKGWPVPRDEFKNITECPFCHHKQGEEITPVEETTLEEPPRVESPRAVINIDEGLEKPSES